MSKTYCRFCAETMVAGAGIDLEKDAQKYQELLVKLTFLNALYVDISHHTNLPRNICFDCYCSLNDSYEFLLKVKKAQEVLSTLFLHSNENVKVIEEESKNMLLSKTGSNDGNWLPLSTLEIKIKDEVKVKPEIDIISEEDQSTDSDDSSELTDSSDDSLPNSPDGEQTPKIVIELTKITDDIPLKSLDKGWKDYPWTCGLCFTEFGDLVKTRQHSINDHNKCAEYTCVDCEKCFDTMNSFIDHVKEHRAYLRYRCHHCDTVCSTDEFETHLKQHVEGLNPCSYCGEIFADDTSLQNHLASLKPRRKTYQKLVNNEDRTCKICNKAFRQPAMLRKHMEIHSTDRKRKYSCEICGKDFLSNGYLTQHVKAHTMVERTHFCPICNKSFTSERFLARHKVIHSAVKPYVCEVCGKSFRIKGRLTTHKIIHSDTFPFKCEYCDKGFNFVQNYRAHILQHTGDKPYSCKECPKEFTGWANLNKHAKRRHGINLSKRQLTPQKTEPQATSSLNELT